MLLILWKEKGMSCTSENLSCDSSCTLGFLSSGTWSSVFLRSDTPWPPASCLPKFPGKGSLRAILSLSLVKDGFPGLICSMFPQTVHCYWGAVLVAGEGRMQCTFCYPLPASPPLHSGFLLPWLAPLFLCFMYRYTAI